MLIFALLSSALIAVAPLRGFVDSPADLVDTRLGSAIGRGSCVIGPCLPHGSVLPGPDTLWPSPNDRKFPPPNGYWPGDPVCGFSQLHCQGTGGVPSYGLFRLVIDVGGRTTSRIEFDETRAYYSRLRLPDLDTTVEMSATENGVLYRLKTPPDAKVRVDENCKIGRANARNEKGEFIGNWNPAPYDCHCFWTRTGDVVRIAVSFNSADEARWFHDAELKGRSLEEIAVAARDAWNDRLSRIRVRGVDLDERRRFYTHLFHAFVQPRRRGGIWDDQYTLWDTWKTLFPLMQLIDPQMAVACVNSFADRMERTGHCEEAFIQGREYRTGQGGNDADNIIADAILKELPGLEVKRLWKVLEVHARDRTPEYIAGGFVAADRPNDYCWRLKSGSATLAFAYNDACAARVARKIGRLDAAEALERRSANWTNVWNGACVEAGTDFRGFVVGRRADGSFLCDAAREGYNTSFYEGTSWEYTFNVWHDLPRLMDMCGGRAAFVRRLEYALGRGLVNFGNEPSFYTPWLFAFAGRPDLTRRAASAVRALFPADGCPGDDDSGAMGALYVFLSLGFMPIAGSDLYVSHGTLLPEVEVDLPALGKTIRLGQGRRLKDVFSYRELGALGGTP